MAAKRRHAAKPASRQGKRATATKRRTPPPRKPAPPPPSAPAPIVFREFVNPPPEPGAKPTRSRRSREEILKGRRERAALRMAERRAALAANPPPPPPPKGPILVEPSGRCDHEAVAMVLACLDERLRRGLHELEIGALTAAYALRLRMLGVRSADAAAAIRARLDWSLAGSPALRRGIERAYVI